jgi:hypothetical protein
VINSSHFLHRALGISGAPAWFLSLGGSGFFWLFDVTLFEAAAG